MARHGGGCFSCKHPSKVDRSGAYAARWVAVNIVRAQLAHRCKVMLACAIGVPEPIAIYLNTFGTGKVSEARPVELIYQHFDLSPQGLIQALELLRPIYQKTAAYSHFGRSEPEFSWERADKAEVLRDEA
jgi:S-adenosylmethionine synthetase